MAINTERNREAILQRLSRIQASMHGPTKAQSNPQLLTENRRLTGADSATLFDHFQRAISTRSTQVVEITSIEDLCPAVAKYLRDSGFAPASTLYGGTNATLQSLNWKEKNIHWRPDQFTDDNCIAIAEAECAIAETGTLVLVSSAQNPSRNNFLAEHHLVVLKRAKIMAYSEDVWDYLKQQFPTLPRAVNFISGPSSSADVGLKLEYGAHGPRNLTVFVMAE